MSNRKNSVVCKQDRALIEQKIFISGWPGMALHDYEYQKLKNQVIS